MPATRTPYGTAIIHAVTVSAIDAGTTGVTALVVDTDGSVVARGYREFPQLFPRPGWVEHEPEDIWTAALSACRQAPAAAPERPTAVGLTNQRETPAWNTG
jgi:glycerol kinase